MKVRIKSFNGDLNSYLTIGKEYSVLHNYEDKCNLPCVKCDLGYEIVLNIICCGHLNGGSWGITCG